MPEQQLHHFFFVFCPAHHAQQCARTGFLHADRHRIYIQRSGCKQLFHGKAKRFPGHVVHVAVKLRYVIARALRLPQQRTDTVGRRKILFAHTVTGGRRLHHRHTAEPCHKMFQ